MMLLYLSLLATISLTIAGPNVTGTWILDWQNVYVNASQYSNLTITETDVASQNLSVVWGIAENKAFNMTFVSTNTWVDDSDQDLVYDPTTDTITYHLSPGYPCLFSRTGSFLSQQDIFGSLSGFWINPTPVNDSTNLSQCCYPTALSFLSNPLEIPQSLSISVFSPTTNCSSHVPSMSAINFGDPSTQTLVWTYDYSVTFKVEFQVSLTPSNSLNQLQVMINNTAPCEFYYYRSNETQPLEGTWLQDWQTTTLSLDSYQVSKINSSNVSYMMSESHLKNGSVYQGYVSEDSNSIYEDTAAFTSSYFLYSYDNQTNTLLGTLLPFLFSPSGSILSSAPFIKSWYALDNSSDSNCCLPSSLTISGQVNTSSLNITYYLPSNYRSQDACVDLLSDISDDTYESTISTATPSITQLIWTDPSYSSQISLANTSTTSVIVVSNFHNQNQCSFSMSEQSPSPPSPLSANVLLTRMMTFVLGIFIMCAL